MDSVTRNFYDNDGLRIAVLDGAGSLSEFNYGAAGQLLSSVSYQTLTNWALRLSGGLAALRAAVVASKAVTHYLYDRKGLQVGSVDALGTLTETSYDNNGNVARKVRYATTVSWQPGASLSSLRPHNVAADRTWSYTYTKR